MFNYIFKAMSFNAKNAVDKAAVKGFAAGESGFGAIEKAAARGRKACRAGKKAHQEALDKRAQEWADFQSFLNGGAPKKQEPVDPEPAPQQPSNGWTDITDGGSQPC